MSETCIVEKWTATHPRWQDLVELVEQEHQTEWVEACFTWHLSSHMLVALQGTLLVGFLRFVIQVIGTDDDHDPVLFDGVALVEAKVMAFGVVPAYQRQGIGYVLQKAALRQAKALGCYQLRSHSDGSHTANHQLKLRMGFAVHPVVRGDDTQGVYFVMPLAHISNESAE